MDTVACCGASFHKDFALQDHGGSEFDLANSTSGPQSVDAFLVPTTCEKLFGGPYPGSSPLCQILIGPATPGKVTTRTSLKTGTYRVWVQAYDSNAEDTKFIVDIGSWDHRCRQPY